MSRIAGVRKMPTMGRETKILLGLLGMLACVFLGALVARLFVARPPVGLGVDIHANVAVAQPEAIVEPPGLGRPDRSAFAAIAPTAPSTATEPEPIAIQGAKPIEEALAAEAPAAVPAAVVPAAFEEPVAGPTAGGPAAVDRVVRPGTNCTVVEGDTWWNLAEAAYGDGRWYRVLYAWNRAVDPGVSLRPGTSLMVPSAAELAAAYPGLVPARASAGRVLP